MEQEFGGVRATFISCDDLIATQAALGRPQDLVDAAQLRQAALPKTQRAGSGPQLPSRTAMHFHYAVDFTVACYIVKDSRVLMIHHRALDKWLPLGGHIDPGEDPDQALLREIREESGLEVEIAAPRAPIDGPAVRALYTPAHVNIHRITDTHSHVVNIYYARWRSGEPVLAAAEHNEIRWFSAGDLSDPRFGVQPDVRWYALDALDRLGSSG
jgi:8-oxo-dGTP pyrophosphatase MutT (NUDIX family)